MTWTCLPEHADWTRLAHPAGRGGSGDVHVGRRVPALLRAGGLVDVEGGTPLRIFRRGDPYPGLLVRFVALPRARILAAGTMTADDLDAAVTRLDDHLAAPGVVT